MAEDGGERTFNKNLSLLSKAPLARSGCSRSSCLTSPGVSCGSDRAVAGCVALDAYQVGQRRDGRRGAQTSVANSAFEARLSAAVLTCRSGAVEAVSNGEICEMSVRLKSKKLLRSRHAPCSATTR